MPTLYVCGTSFGWECVPENSGNIEFYTSAEALKNDRNCWEECGIIEVHVTFAKEIAPPGPFKGMSAKELEEAEKVYVPLGERLAQMAKDEGGQHAERALVWARGTIRSSERKKGKKIK